MRTLRYERLEFRRLLAATCGESSWPLEQPFLVSVSAAEGEDTATDTNPSEPADVNADGYLSALDPLLIANQLEQYYGEPGASDAGQPPYLDFNADGLVDQADRDGVVQAVDQAGPGQLPEPRFEVPPSAPPTLYGKLVSVRLAVTGGDGNPLQRVEQGQAFHLEAWVADLRDDVDPRGVFASYIDASYDAARVTLDGQVEHGPDYSRYAADDTSEPGRIDDAGSGREEALWDASEHLLWRVPMRAEEVGIAEFFPDASEVEVEYPTLLSGLETPVPAENMRFEGATLLVSGPPVAHDDLYYVLQDQSLQVGNGQGVLANDEGDEGETRTAELVTPAAYGTVRLNSDGSFEYNPEPGFAGWDQFTYRAHDGYFDSNPATVFINVIPSDSTPLAVDDDYVVQPDGSLSVDHASGLLANDQHTDYPSTLVVLVSGTEHGELTLAPDGSFIYTPGSGFADQDQFSYRIETGFAVSNVATVRLSAQEFDSDLDGVSDAVENAAPHGGDFNADGIPDRQQGHVASLPAGGNSQYVRFETTAATPFREMRTVAPASGNGAPANVEFPYGFFGFEIHGLEPGGGATVTFTPEEELAANVVYRVGPTPDDGSTHWYPFMRNGATGAMVFSDRVELLYTDGDFGDDDLSADQVLTNLVLAIGSVQNPWRNPRIPEDVDNSGSVTPADALILINLINHGGMRLLPAVPDPGTAIPSFVDPNGDNRLTPEDVLEIINEINEQTGGTRLSGEGESAGPEPAPAGESSEPLPVDDPAAATAESFDVPAPGLSPTEPVTFSTTVSVLGSPADPPPRTAVQTETSDALPLPAESLGGDDDEPLLALSTANRRGEDELEQAIDQIAGALASHRLLSG